MGARNNIPFMNDQCFSFSVTKLVCRLGLLDEPEDGDLYWRLLMKSSLEQKDMVEMQWSQSTERVANFVAW